MQCTKVLVLASYLWLTALCIARAEPIAKAPPGYAEAIAAGLTELEANNYPEAREEFRRAHSMFPNARTLRGLGMVEFELRNYAESVRLLEEALSSSVKPLSGPLRTETEGLLSRARRYLGELQLEIDPPVPALLIDGVRVELPAEGLLRLEVGEHTLDVTAEGRAPERRVVRIEGGERVNLQIALRYPPTNTEVTASPRRSPDLTAPTTPVRADKPAYKKWWVWTTVAIVLAGGATATAILLTRDDQPDPEAVAGTNTIGVSLQTLGSF